MSIIRQMVRAYRAGYRARNARADGPRCTVLCVGPTQANEPGIYWCGRRLIDGECEQHGPPARVDT